MTRPLVDDPLTTVDLAQLGTPAEPLLWDAVRDDVRLSMAATAVQPRIAVEPAPSLALPLSLPPADVVPDRAAVRRHRTPTLYTRLVAAGRRQWQDLADALGADVAGLVVVGLITAGLTMWGAVVALAVIP